jgi:hypothetical protein
MEHPANSLWAVPELGVERTQMAKRLMMSQAGIAYATSFLGINCKERRGHFKRKGDSNDRIITELQKDVPQSSPYFSEVHRILITIRCGFV